MEIGNKVRVVRFGRIGTIVDIQKSAYDRNLYIVQYNEYESEGLYEFEIELE